MILFASFAMSGLCVIMMMAVPWRLTKSSENWEDLYRYRRIWRFSVTLTLVVSLMPLFVMTAVNYFLYQKNLKTATEYDVSRNVTNISRSLQFVIEERVAALEFLVLEKTRQELSDEGRMTQAFQDLKKSFGLFVDLGLINSDGDQGQYSGPYNLRDSNYSDQNWFHEVILRDMHVSDVFLGYRQFPHFVIAIYRETSPGRGLVLRATIDTGFIDRLVRTLMIQPGGDAFLVVVADKDSLVILIIW